jgi:flagellar L-ring protein precursor FlgH
MQSYNFRVLYLLLVAGCLSLTARAAAPKKPKVGEPSALDRYIHEATQHPAAPADQASAGSLWSPASRLTDLATDVRAAHVDDLLTVLVAEQASAVAKGATQTARQSSVKASVSALGGITNKTGPWQNLADASTNTQLNGSGSTSRQTSLSTTLSARVTHVLPNGYLVLEGTKDVMVNSERQIVTVRGVVRPADLSPGNLIRSDQIAQMEIKVNGKGVIGDAIRRPFILYRILLGLLPF